MPNDDFIHYILIPELATKFCMKKDNIIYKQALLMFYENDFQTHYNVLMDQAFILNSV